MASSQLQTVTLIDYKNDFTATIKCLFINENGDELPNILFVDVAESSINYNGTLIQEGNLLAFLKNYPDQISLQIDDRGHLILFLQPIENNYSVEQTEGRLLYDKQ